MKGIVTWYFLVVVIYPNIFFTCGGPIPQGKEKESEYDSRASKRTSLDFIKTTLTSKIAIEIPPKKETIEFGSLFYDRNDDELRDDKEILGRIYKRNGEEALARPSGSDQHMASNDDQEIHNNGEDHVRTVNETHNELLGSPAVNHREKVEGDLGEEHNETNHDTASHNEGEGRVPHPRGNAEHRNSEENAESRGVQNRTSQGSSSGNREESLVPHPDQVGGESPEHSNHGSQIERPSTFSPHISSSLSIHHEEHALEPIEHLNISIVRKLSTTLLPEIPQHAVSTFPTEVPPENHRSETESGVNVPDHVDSHGGQAEKNTEIPQTEIPAQTLPDNKPIEMTDLNPAEIPNPDEHIKGFGTEPHLTTRGIGILTEGHLFPAVSTTEEPPRRLPDIEPGAGTVIEPTEVPKDMDTEEHHEPIGEKRTTSHVSEGHPVPVIPTTEEPPRRLPDIDPGAGTFVEPTDTPKGIVTEEHNEPIGETRTTTEGGHVPVVTIRIPHEVLTPIPTEFPPGGMFTTRRSATSSTLISTKESLNEDTLGTTSHLYTMSETSLPSIGDSTHSVKSELSTKSTDSFQTQERSIPTYPNPKSSSDVVNANTFQTYTPAVRIDLTSTMETTGITQSSGKMLTGTITVDRNKNAAWTSGTSAHEIDSSSISTMKSSSQKESQQSQEATSGYIHLETSKMSPSMESLRTFTYEQRRSTESRQSKETYQTPEVSQSILWSSLRPVSSKEQGSSYDVSTLSSVIIKHATTHQILPQTSANMKHHINISESVNTTRSVHSQRPSTHSSVSNGTMKPSSTPKSELKPSSSIRPSGPSSKSHGQIPTPRPVVPPVFIRLQFKMTLSEFCSEKSKFITELVEIVQTETAQRLEDDQIVFLNSHEISCIPEYDEIMPPSKMDDEHVKIDLYVIDVKGEIDITLTIDFEKMIVPGFKTLPQSHFGEKLVDVKLVQQKSPSSEASSEDSSSSSLGSGITVAIIIASVGGFCCCCLIILQIIIHKRHGKRFNNFDSASTQLSIRSMDSIALGAVPKSRPHSGFFNPGLEYDDQTANKEPSHLLGYTSLSNFTLDTRGMEHEFEKIPYEMPNLATVPIGAEDKNRFANVIPHPHTRVKLKTIEGEDTSEYINANYVTGYRGNFKAYIATQAPMTNTMRDFWRMVWEQQSRVILMLVPMDERGQPKCNQYWPEEEGMNGRMKFWDYTIVMKRKDVHQEYITSVLEIKDIENNLLREIRHFWITCWPRDGLPEPISLIKFILDTRVHYEDSGAPVIVHCSPGTGRTGTLIATDICMRSYERKRMVDILNSVHKLRQERAGAVQTKEQYTLIYKAVYEYSVIMSSPSISTASSAIALHNML